MITQIINLPQNVIGFEATNKVNADDFKNVLVPAVENFMKDRKDLNYLLVLDTNIANFSAGAWLQDAFLGVKNLTAWNRSVIISESEGVKTFTNIFSKLMPGEFRVYAHAQYDEAVKWLEKGD